MKALLVLIFSFIAFPTFSQGRLSGTVNLTEPLGGPHYASFSWQASYTLAIQDKKLVISVGNGSINLQPNSVYVYYNETYTKADLGLSSWPARAENPNSMVVRVNVHVNGKSYPQSITHNGQFPSTVGYLRDLGNVDLNAVSVTVSGMAFNPLSDDKVNSLIIAKKNGNKKNGNQKASSTLNNPTTGAVAGVPSAVNNTGSSASRAQQQVLAQQQVEAVANLAVQTTNFISGIISDAREKRKSKVDAQVAKAFSEANQYGVNIEKAKQGDPQSMYLVGSYLRLNSSKEGNVLAHYKEISQLALQWLKQAADAGNKDAVGDLYSMYLGFPTDYSVTDKKEAAYWGNRLDQMLNEKPGPIELFTFKSTSSNDILEEDLDWQSLNSRLSAYKRKNMHLSDITAYVKDGRVLYAAVWRQGVKRQELRKYLDYELKSEAEKLCSKKMFIADIEGFYMGGREFIAGIWEEGDGEQHIEHVAVNEKTLDWRDFSAVHNKLIKEGKYPYAICSNLSEYSDVRSFYIVFRTGYKTMLREMTPFAHVEMFIGGMQGVSYQLHRVNRITVQGETKYNMIFIKEEKSPPLTKYLKTATLNEATQKLAELGSDINCVTILH